MSPLKSVPVLAALVAAGLLALAPSASAIYIVTPLTLHPSETQVDAGDNVSFRVEPQNESEAAAWAGQTVSVRYTWDANERNASEEGPDAPTSSSAMQERVLLDALTLDGEARAAFDWVVPDEVDGHNVDVALVDADGEIVAIAHLAVGDAPPAMRILAGSGPAPEPSTGAPEDRAASDDAPVDDAAAEESAGERQTVPGAGVLAVVAAVGALAVVLARRR